MGRSLRPTAEVERALQQSTATRLLLGTPAPPLPSWVPRNNTHDSGGCPNPALTLLDADLRETARQAPNALTESPVGAPPQVAVHDFLLQRVAQRIMQQMLDEKRARSRKNILRSACAEDLAQAPRSPTLLQLRRFLFTANAFKFRFRYR